jgi:segregation and condensation protein A
LIERSQMQITDVSLVTVTDQFLAYIQTLDETRPDLIADFTNVSARLVLLKSRSLLPRPPAADDEDEPGDLARELIEYRAVKRAAFALGEKDKRGEGGFTNRPGNVAAPGASGPLRLMAHDPAWLTRALRRRFTAVHSTRHIMQTRPMISLREVVERVLDQVTGRRESSFGRIAHECRDTHELRTTFLAVLVLIRRRVIDAEQRELFGEIVLTRVETQTGPPAIALAYSADD